LGTFCWPGANKTFTRLQQEDKERAAKETGGARVIKEGNGLVENEADWKVRRTRWSGTLKVAVLGGDPEEPH
jgi:hypothetical protein